MQKTFHFWYIKRCHEYFATRWCKMDEANGKLERHGRSWADKLLMIRQWYEPWRQGIRLNCDVKTPLSWISEETHTQRNDLREDDVGQLCFDRRIWAAPLRAGLEYVLVQMRRTLGIRLTFTRLRLDADALWGCLMRRWEKNKGWNERQKTFLSVSLQSDALQLVPVYLSRPRLPCPATLKSLPLPQTIHVLSCPQARCSSHTHSSHIFPSNPPLSSPLASPVCGYTPNSRLLVPQRPACHTQLMNFTRYRHQQQVPRKFSSLAIKTNWPHGWLVGGLFRCRGSYRILMHTCTALISTSSAQRVSWSVLPKKKLLDWHGAVLAPPLRCMGEMRQLYWLWWVSRTLHAEGL